MQPKEFREVNIRIAESQPEFETLPAHYNQEEGSITFCFQLNDDEIKKMKESGEVWFKVFNAGQPMQPIFLSTIKEDLISMSNVIPKLGDFFPCSLSGRLLEEPSEDDCLRLAAYRFAQKRVLWDGAIMIGGTFQGSCSVNCGGSTFEFSKKTGSSIFKTTYQEEFISFFKNKK